MKPYTFFVFLFFIVTGYSQALYTFQNTTATTIISGGNATLPITVSGVPATGMVLRQVNISFGNTSTSSSGNVDKVKMILKDVGGTSSIMLSTASFDGDVGDYKLFDIHLRDNNVLKTPKAQKAATSSVISKGYPFHYGYYKPEGNFSSFNTTTNVNGTWQFIVNNGAGGSRMFTKIELVFGPAIVATDIRTTKTNTSCATQQCIDGTKVYYATNNGYPTNQTVTPPNTVSGCKWNGQTDNNNWFFFQASGSTAYVSISGFSTVQESSVFTVSACSASATYGIVAGGCGPSDMFSGSDHSQKYYNSTYTGGYEWNHGYYLSGLVSGTNYIFVIDGSNAAKSDFYVEILGNSLSCSLILPIELIYFNGDNKENSNILNWATSSELNNSKFELEKSNDGILFKSLTSIDSKAAKGNSQHHIVYEYRDVPCNAYYRLKQVDVNGSFKYHKTIFVENTEEKKKPIIMPNPATNNLTVSYWSKTNKQATISIYDLAGREIISEQTIFNEENQESILNIEALNKGLYFMSISSDDKVYQYKVIKE